jgi:hypothetical protein
VQCLIKRAMNSLTVALRKFERIERTLFTLHILSVHTLAGALILCGTVTRPHACRHMQIPSGRPAKIIPPLRPPLQEPPARNAGVG